MSTRILFLIVFCLGTSYLFSQVTDDILKFETALYVPDKKITNLLDEEKSQCFDENNIDSKDILYYLKFNKKQDSIFLTLLTSKKPITDIAVQFGGLNIKGVFYYQNKIGIIDIGNNTEIDFIFIFFQRTNRVVTNKIELDIYGEPSCGSTYYVMDEKILFLNRSNSF